MSHVFRGVVMKETVSVEEARRRFAQLPRGAREGRSYVITAHGRPVAEIVPASIPDRTRGAARTQLLARLRAQSAVDAGRWTRDELYADAT
jgi:prevent-host-death family protein